MARDCQEWRDYFPRGLRQPGQGFRFSIDSLLLSCYPQLAAGDRVLDLGTGCGVASFGLLIQNLFKEAEVIGVEISRELTNMADENAHRLCLAESFLAIDKDVKEIRSSQEFQPEDFDQVICNPPYREFGRRSPYQDKNKACFTSQASLEDFVAAASYSLKNKGRFVIVFLAERLCLVMSLLRTYRLEPKRVRFVHSLKDHSAYLFLMESRKNVNPGLTVDPPLIIYQEQSSEKKFTDEILNFCPFLRCNS